MGLSSVRPNGSKTGVTAGDKEAVEAGRQLRYILPTCFNQYV